jgi:hypothetical protein
MEIGDRVKKVNGYSFSGIIVAKFKKLDPTQVRVVVECNETVVSGMLHIFREDQLKKVLEGDQDE